MVSLLARHFLCLNFTVTKWEGAATKWELKSFES